MIRGADEAVALLGPGPCKREPLVARGESSATTDQSVAEALLGERIKDLQKRRRDRTLLGVEKQAHLAEYASHHLVQKAKSGRFTVGWLGESEVQLTRAVEFLGANRSLN